MNRPATFMRLLSRLPAQVKLSSRLSVRKGSSIRSQCFRSQRRYNSNSRNPADDPNFISIVDQPPQMVRVGHSRRHGPGLIILAIIPLAAFALGTWQVQRLTWKTDLIARLEDRLIRPPLPLPPRIDPTAVPEFDYRRVYATGRFRHDQEMLVGPRMMEGEDGFLVVTPLERDGASKILCCRGWISKKMRDQRAREGKEALPTSEVTVQGLLREPWKKNMFTPENSPERGAWYFPDLVQMAEYTGSEPIWIEETMRPDLLESYNREAKGIPIGRPAAVNLRNNHTQYIFTWYSLGIATSIMLWMVVKKPSSGVTRRVQQSRNWS